MILYQGHYPRAGSSLDAVDDCRRWAVGWSMCKYSIVMFVEGDVSWSDVGIEIVGSSKYVRDSSLK